MMSKNLRRSSAYQGVCEVLALAGVAHEVVRRGKHPKIRFAAGGKPITIVIGATPSDWRARRNMRALTRRLLRESAGCP
jgi:hypothetical protein